MVTPNAEKAAPCGCQVGGLHRYACALVGHVDPPRTVENGLPVLCDERGDRCCGTPACLNAGLWKDDPYDQPIGVVEGTRWHMHAEPICAEPDCVTYLTRSQMATMRARTRPIPPGVDHD